MLKIRLLIVVLFLALPTFANAQYGQHRDYVGGGFVRGDLTYGNVDFDLNTLDLRLGVEMTKWFHLEGRVDFGLNDKAIGGVEVSINRALGIHGVFSLPNKTPVRPYAVAGLTYGEVDFRLPGIGRADENETDVSFGAGADIAISDGLDLFVEYMQYIDKGIIDFSGISVGIKFEL